MIRDWSNVRDNEQYSLKLSNSTPKNSEHFGRKTLNAFSKHFRKATSLRSSFYCSGFQFITEEMLPQGISAIGVWYYQIPVLLGFATTFWILLKLWRHARERQIRVIPASWNGIHSHQWSLIECLSHRATCCLCRSLIVDAMFCDSCGVCLDFSCYNVTQSRFLKLKRSLKATPRALEPLGQCKAVSISRKEEETFSSWPHHWVHGNLPANSLCFICHGYCEDDVVDGVSKAEGDHPLPAGAGEHTLYHYRCCWCQRTVHEACHERHQDRVSEPCDFGPYRRYIIPPNCIIHKRVWSGRRTLLLDGFKEFNESQWSPLVVVANRKSGNNDAGAILSKFLPVLNPLQVVDLSESSNHLELILRICEMLPKNVEVRILVAGGDGTVGWVLDTIHRLKLNVLPLVAICPLGTGNDLARVLSWDQSMSADLDLDQMIKLIWNHASPVNLDRWSVEIHPSGYYHRSYSLLIQSLHIPPSIMPLGHRQLYMYNYFSVGVDALVALNFHETRKSSLYKFLFTNTLVNKFIYLTYGTKDLLERRCKNLHTKIKLELDGSQVILPELESIVVLNIASWGGGVKLVKPSHQAMDDCLVEVLGLTSTFHIGQLMIGLSKPIFLGRARKVSMTLSEHLPVQADGEPWLQAPSQIEVTWNSHARLLQCTDT